MPSGRRIIYSHECNKSAERLGGWRILDRALEPILDGLERNPYGFPKYESDWVSIRYVITKPIPGAPRLAWYFTINGMDVEILDVEEYEGY